MPTLRPGWNLVPRWRTRMLPGITASPPAHLRPRRRPWESRPLREEPPAFLCAIACPLGSAGADAGDAQHGQRLAVAALAAVIVAALFLEDQHLVVELLFQHLGGDRGARNERHARLDRRTFVADHQHLVQCHGRARLGRELLDEDHVVLGDSILFSAGADDSVHGARLALWKIERTAFAVRARDNSRKALPVNGFAPRAAGLSRDCRGLGRLRA